MCLRAMATVPLGMAGSLLRPVPEMPSPKNCRPLVGSRKAIASLPAAEANLSVITNLVLPPHLSLVRGRVGPKHERNPLTVSPTQLILLAVDRLKTIAGMPAVGAAIPGVASYFKAPLPTNSLAR